MNEEVSKGPGGVIAVNLIDPPAAVAFDDSFASEKPFPQDRASGSIESAQTGHIASGEQRHLFGLQENLAGLTIRLGLAGFVHPGAVRLRIDRGAANKKTARGWKVAIPLRRPSR